MTSLEKNIEDSRILFSRIILHGIESAVHYRIMLFNFSIGDIKVIK